MNSTTSYESIKLIIEKKPFICDKNLLTNHSEYFKRILGPNKFKESDTHELEVKDVEYNIMELVLKLTIDPSYYIGEENILMVLEAADMLQFSSVSDLCIKQVTELISIHTCIKIWFMTEHIHSTFGCVPIYLKAKSFALQEFEAIKDTTTLKELNLSQICSYLGNTQLQCNKEVDVFQVFMKWWYDNCKNNDKILTDTTKNFGSMLFCLDFNALTVADINEMLTYPDISENASIVNCLNCIICIKKNESTGYYSNEILYLAKNLLNAKERFRQTEPYLVTNIVKLNCKIRKEIKVVDEYKRKRTLYEESDAYRNKHNEAKSISFYDISQNTIEHFLVLPDNKANLLKGCQMVSYKEFIFFFGGETDIGRGNWNMDFWVYDTIKEIWCRKTRLPSGRRHFQCCVVDSKLFMIGGTGAYRVLQNDMLFYDFKTDIWSKPIELPNNSGCLKCCTYLGQLLLVDSGVRVTYLFNAQTFTFVKILFDVKSLPFKYSVYAIAENLYMKGTELLQFKLQHGHFVLQETFTIESQILVKCDQFNSILCSNYLFSIYKDGNSVFIDKFNIKTMQTSLLHHVNTDEEYQQNSGTFKFRYTDLFAFSRFELFKEDCYVNNFLEYMKSAD